LREARRRLDERRAAEAKPIPRLRSERLREGKRRLDEEHDVHCRANEAYEDYRARGVMKGGRRFGKPPTRYTPTATPEGKVNITDPDSRNVKTPRGLHAGLQRPSRLQREPDRPGRRAQHGLAGLRPPRSDGHRGRARAFYEPEEGSCLSCCSIAPVDSRNDNVR
jgi:hypothetical protein